MIKKKFIIAILTTLCLSASACGSGNEEPVGGSPGEGETTIPETVGKTLIVFFSWGGNTRAVANHIHNIIGGDMIEVETVVPYPDTYEEVIAIAPGELESDYRPELKTSVENIDQYDTIIVGTPIWGGRLAPAMKSFLASYNLSGKTIAPFCTHGGSGTARSVDDIRSVCPGSEILGSLAVNGSRVSNARSDVQTWLERIGIVK